MTHKDWRIRVEDMLDAIEHIAAYVAGLDHAAFRADERCRDAVVRNLEILGEAAKRVPPDIARRHPDLPWSRLGDMRNILAHEYHSVDPDIILDTARHDLPPLVGPLRDVLDTRPDPRPPPPPLPLKDTP